MNTGDFDTFGRVVALSGGVGGAKLAVGLTDLLPPEDLLVVCNTGDDFEHLGLRISPDLDSVMYALAGVHDTQRGWGRRDESWAFLDTVRELSPEDAWFQLGDRDLATHVLRTAGLRAGKSLSDVTAELCAAHGIEVAVAPMSNDYIATVVETERGDLPFQHYFVREQCDPEFRGVSFDGVRNAWPAPAVGSWLDRDDLAAVVLCPSNPYLSIAPILAVPGVLHRIEKLLSGDGNRRTPVVAVSPIVGGEALKGPAAKILRELGVEPSALAVARYYVEQTEARAISHFVLDQVDAAQRSQIEALGLEVLVADTVMRDREASARLAAQVLEFVA